MASNPNSQPVFLDNPRLVFLHFVNMILESEDQNNVPAIAITSHIPKSAKTGKNCKIGKYVYIGEKCAIGDNVVEDHVSLKNCRIADGCISEWSLDRL